MKNKDNEIKQNVVGIYKITNSSGKVYIGQSINVLNRKEHYKRFNCSTMGIKLKNSLNKYSWENHTFEIIEECGIEQLNEKETYYKQIELDKVNGDWSKVLFCDLYDLGGGPKSEATKLKISESWKNKSIEEQNLINYKRGLGNKGKIVSKESKNKMSISHLGKKFSEETRLKMSLSKKGKMNKEHKIKLMFSRKGKEGRKKGSKYSEESKLKMAKSSCKSIYQYNINNKIINKFNSLTEAAKHNNISIATVNFILYGKIKKPKYIFKFV